MTTHFIKEIDNVKRSILELGARVEKNVREAVAALEDQDAARARAVIEADLTIDRQEVEFEEECLKILALYQPVASDLRFLVSVLKINNDLERISDLSAKIAKRAIRLSSSGRLPVVLDFSAMADKAQGMLRRSLDALVTFNAGLAREVCAADAEVNTLRSEALSRIKEGLRKADTPEAIDLLVDLLGVSRHLERIADHATNIAEDVIYMTEGDIVRHRP